MWQTLLLAMPVCRDGQLVNIKYRGLPEKKFWQVGCVGHSQLRQLRQSCGSTARQPAACSQSVCPPAHQPPPPPTPSPSTSCCRHAVQCKGAEKVLFGLDDAVGQGAIIIVEGEMDKLALEEAGMTNVLSVGACNSRGGVVHAIARVGQRGFCSV